MSTRSGWRAAWLRWTTAAVGLVVALSACGTDTRQPPGAHSPTANTPAQPGPLTVLTPTEGDVVNVPFEVTVETGTELGPIEDGLHHWHVWFEDTQDAPSVVTTSTTTVDGDEIPAPSGQTTMHVQLHTAEHEPAGEVISISLTVNEDTDSDTGDDDRDTGDPGYTY